MLMDAKQTKIRLISAVNLLSKKGYVWRTFI